MGKYHDGISPTWPVDCPTHGPFALPIQLHQSTVPPSVTRCKHHQAKDWETTKEPDMLTPGGVSSGLEFVNTLDFGPFSD